MNEISYLFSLNFLLNFRPEDDPKDQNIIMKNKIHS